MKFRTTFELLELCLKAIIKKKPDLDIVKLANAKNLKITSEKYIKDIDSYIKF